MIEKYRLPNDILTKMLNLYLTILRKYTIPVYGTISFIKDSYALFFKSNEDWKAFLKDISDFNKQNADQLIPLFRLSNLNRELNDIKMDGYYGYNKNTFIETLFSPTNAHINSYVENSDYKPMPITELIQTYIKVEDNVNKNLIYVDFKINFLEKNTDENYRRFDFADFLNIGNESYQKKLEQYQNKRLRRNDFYNVR